MDLDTLLRYDDTLCALKQHHDNIIKSSRFGGSETAAAYVVVVREGQQKMASSPSKEVAAEISTRSNP